MKQYQINKIKADAICETCEYVERRIKEIEDMIASYEEDLKENPVDWKKTEVENEKEKTKQLQKIIELLSK